MTQTQQLKLSCIDEALFLKYGRNSVSPGWGFFSPYSTKDKEWRRNEVMYVICSLHSHNVMYNALWLGGSLWT